MTDQSRRMAGGGAAPIINNKSAASEPTPHGRTPNHQSPASEASPDAIRTCYLRHGDRVGIGMTPLILMAYGEGVARLMHDQADRLGRDYASCGVSRPHWLIITSNGHEVSWERCTKEKRAGRTALRLSPAEGGLWRLEIDADPAVPLMLNARMSEAQG